MESKFPTLEEIQISFPGIFQNLKASSFSQVCKGLGTMTNTIIENNPTTRDWLKVLGEGSETRVEAALFRSDFTHIHEVRGEFTPVLQVSSLRNKLKNTLLEWAIKHGRTALKEYEKKIICAFIELSPIFDDVFIQWRENIRNSEIGKHVAWLEEEETGSGAMYLLKKKSR